MRLALGSAAAPSVPLAGLVEACVRRGMEGIFLGAGDGHGVRMDAPAEALARLRAEAADAGVAIIGVESGWADACAEGAPRASAALAAPLVVRGAEVDAVELLGVVARYEQAGGRLLVTVPAGCAREWAARVAGLGSPALGLAWEIFPGSGAPADASGDLAALAPHLELVRLYGGGPETLSQTGQGVGAVMARLTLARFGGALAIEPSRPETRTAWAAWLRRRAGTGCGSAANTTTLEMGGSR